MMRSLLAVAAILFLAISPCAAQDQSAFITKALGVLQQQRDNANNEVVNAQARLAVSADENATLRKEIESLKARLKDLESQPVKEPEQKQ